MDISTSPSPSDERPRPGVASSPALAAFLIVTYLTAWLPTLPVVLDRLGPGDPVAPPAVFFLGFGFAPALGALVVLSWTGGRPAVRNLVGRFALRRVRGWWIAVAGGGVLGYVLLGRLAALLANRTEAPPARLWAQALSLAIPVLIAAALEEAGWRGYLLPALQSHMTALPASLVVGVVWGLWHLPLLLQSGTVNGSLPIWWYPAGAVLGSVTYAALFNVTRGSLLVTTLVHAALNVASTPFVQAEYERGRDLAPGSLIGLALSGVVAVIVLIVARPRELSRTPRVRLTRDEMFDAHGRGGSD